MSLTLEVSDNLHLLLGIPRDQLEKHLRLELAVALYAQNLLSMGKAADVAGLNRFNFNDILAGRNIPMHYGQKELEEDLDFARVDNLFAKTNLVTDTVSGCGGNSSNAGTLTH
jgi:predicted HTH domain antitoxin